MKKVLLTLLALISFLPLKAQKFETIWTKKGDYKAVTIVKFTPKGDKVFVGYQDGIAVLDAVTGKEITKYPKPSSAGPVCSDLDICYDGNLVLELYADRKEHSGTNVYLLNLSTGLRKVLPGLTSVVQSPNESATIKFIPNTTKFYCHFNDSLCLCDTSGIIKMIDYSQYGWVNNSRKLYFNKDNSIMYSIMLGPFLENDWPYSDIIAYDLNNNYSRKIICPKTNFHGFILSMAQTSNGDIFYTTQDYVKNNNATPYKVFSKNSADTAYNITEFKPFNTDFNPCLTSVLPGDSLMVFSGFYDSNNKTTKLYNRNTGLFLDSLDRGIYYDGLQLQLTIGDSYYDVRNDRNFILNDNDNLLCVKIKDLISNVTEETGILNISVNYNNGELHIVAPENLQIDNLTISDVSGNVIQNLTSGIKNVIPIKLASGVYFVQVSVNGKTSTFKFIKE